MKDLFSFLLRGAIGAIIGGTLLAFIASFYSGYFLILIAALTPYILVSEIVCGVFVGLTCFLAVCRLNRMSWLVRFAAGTGVMSGVFIALTVYQSFIQGEALESKVATVFYSIVFVLEFSLAIGGPAGLACPARRLRIRERQLRYSERVRLYVAAEAKLARKKNSPEEST